MRRLVPGTICSVLKNQAPILRSKPETPVNFLYVDDAAAAILCLAEQIAGGRTSLRTVTVRNQLSTTLGEMVDTILACMERPELRQETARGGDVLGHAPAGVETLTGEDWAWKPRVSLEDGLRKTISWYQQYFAE